MVVMKKNGTEVLEILDCGIQTQEDVVTYPDEDVVYVKPLKKKFRLTDAMQNWSSEPNEER